MRKSILYLMVMVIIIMLIGFVEGKARYGEAVPKNSKVVKLKEILEHPDIYKDKEVVLEGNYGNYCCASDFVYKEGIEAFEVYPKGFPMPKLERGKPIKIYGIVRSIEKDTKTKQDEEGTYEVYIEAKGMEIK